MERKYKDIKTTIVSGYKDTENEAICFTNDVKEILAHAFLRNNRIKFVKIESDNVELNNEIFAYSNLEELEINCNLKNISTGCCMGCSSLKAVKARNLEVIEKGGLAYCSSLTELDCRNLRKIGNAALSITGLQSVQLDNIEEIGRDAFMGTNLKTALIGKKLKNIEMGAFAKTMLKEIVIPESIEFLGKGIFNGTPIEQIYVDVNQKDLHKIKGIEEYLPLVKTREEFSIDMLIEKGHSLKTLNNLYKETLEYEH